jgi:hypothetical protein
VPQGAQQGKKYRDALLDAEVDRLARFYSDAEKEILRIINKALLKGDDLKYMQGMLQNVQAILGDLRAGSKTWCEEAVPHIYTEGIQFADAEIARYGGQVISGFGAIHQEAAQVLAENTYNRYADVVDFIGRRTDDIRRKLALESVRGTVVGYETWQQVADNYRAKLAEEGITGFRDRANREWNMSTYAEMVARTTTMQVHLEGTANRLLEQGHDLIEISSHVGACPLCVPWEGKVLSLTGKTPGYPTLEEAKAAGLFHVNCRHAYGLYIDLDKEIERLEAELAAAPVAGSDERGIKPLPAEGVEIVNDDSIVKVELIHTEDYTIPSGPRKGEVIKERMGSSEVRASKSKDGAITLMHMMVDEKHRGKGLLVSLLDKLVEEAGMPVTTSKLFSDQGKGAMEALVRKGLSAIIGDGIDYLVHMKRFGKVPIFKTTEQAVKWAMQFSKKGERNI